MGLRPHDAFWTTDRRHALERILRDLEFDAHADGALEQVREDTAPPASALPVDTTSPAYQAGEQLGTAIGGALRRRRRPVDKTSRAYQHGHRIGHRIGQVIGWAVVALITAAPIAVAFLLIRSTTH